MNWLNNQSFYNNAWIIHRMAIILPRKEEKNPKPQYGGYISKY
jgi:hypothetical protein